MPRLFIAISRRLRRALAEADVPFDRKKFSPHITIIRRAKGSIGDIPIYSYCLSGARSGRAVSALRAMGYVNATNIGGINRYRGELEKQKKRERDHASR